MSEDQERQKPDSVDGQFDPVVSHEHETGNAGTRDSDAVQRPADNLEFYKDQNISLKEEKAELQRLSDKLDKEVNKLRKKVSDLTNSQAGLEDMLTAERTVKTNLQRDRDSKANEIEALRKDIDEAQRRKKVEMELGLKHARSWMFRTIGLGALSFFLLMMLFVATYLAPHITCNTYINRIEIQNLQLKSIKSENENLIDESEKVNKELKGIKEESSEVKNQLELEKIKFDAANTSKAHIQDQLTKAISEKSQIEDAKRKIEKESTEVKTQLKEVENQLEAVKASKADIEDELTKTISEKSKIEDAKRRIEEAKENLEVNKANLERNLQDLQKKMKNIDALDREVDDLQIKLSRCRVANDPDSVSNYDLSPIKLGQDFRALYEQHYTMALDELDALHGEGDIRTTTQYFLNILKSAHKLAETYTQQHVESMKQSTVTIEIKKSTEDMESRVSVNSTLSNMDWRDFYQIRQKCAWRMLDQMSKELGDILAKDFEVDVGSQPKMITYIQECVSLCWKANMHKNPVYIDFFEPDGTQEFDYDTYKPFMNPNGNQLDFVVWPPMYENKGGRMVGKGIAEKKD